MNITHRKGPMRGFTLVELSIVLVIVGLIIGGILAAKSMINTSKMVKIISLAEQYKTAARNFRTTYNYWPGDYPNAAFGCAGDGDEHCNENEWCSKIDGVNSECGNNWTNCKTADLNGNASS